MTEPKKEKCEACYGSGYINFWTDDGHISMRTCRRCDGYGYIKVVPMTNEEWLRSATTEQLAEYLADKFNEVVDFVLHEVDENAEDIEPDDYWYRQGVVAEWLKQPHK